MTVCPSERLIFLHMVKTAGLSFAALLARQYPGARIFQLRGAPANFARLSLQEREAFQIVWGHFEYGVHRLFDTPSRYLTFVRDPIERVISHFSYNQWNATQEYHERVNTSGISLERWVRFGTGPAVDNLQVRRLTLRDGDYVAIKQTTRGMLDEAKRVLAEDIEFVGITDRYDDSVEMFARQLGWQQPLTMERINAAPRRRAASDLTPGERAAIVEHNRMDIELYDFAVDLFERRRAASRTAT